MAKRSRGKSFYDLQRDKTIKSRKKKVNVTAFNPTARSISGKVCEFLLWAREKYPKYFILHEEITQAIFSLGRMPTKSSKHVRSVANAMGRARKVMKDKFQQDIIVQRGVGARATVDDLDVMTTSVMRDVEKHERTARNLKETVGLIDSKQLDKLIAEAPAEIRDDLAISKQYFQEYLMKYMKLLEKPTNVKALLPPIPSSVAIQP